MGDWGRGRRSTHVAFNPNVAEKTTLFGLTRSVLFIITVINISIGADNKAETTYLGFRSDLKKCWGGCSNWIWRKENENSLVRGDPEPLPPSQMAFSVFSGGAAKHWPVRTGQKAARQLLLALPSAPSGSGTLLGPADPSSQLP